VAHRFFAQLHGLRDLLNGVAMGQIDWFRFEDPEGTQAQLPADVAVRPRWKGVNAIGS